MIKFFRKIRYDLMSKNKTGRYLKYAFGEIILVVIGILIALQVNNWNENRNENKKVNKYAISLIEDFKADIEMLKVSQFQALKKLKMIDSLRHIINSTDFTKLSNTDIYVLTHDILYRPYKWNRSTLNELNSSASTRFIKNEKLRNKLMAYETFTKHLDEDFEYDKSIAIRADNQISLVLNLNSIYLSKLKEKENENFNTQRFNIFETEEYYISKKNDLDLLITSKSEILSFVNTFIQIQDQYKIRAENEMERIIADANELIQLLKEEYQLND